jgi:hypothetical protein
MAQKKKKKRYLSLIIYRFCSLEHYFYYYSFMKLTPFEQ